MKGRISTWTKALAALAMAGVAAAAHASPGNGIRLGGSEARLHPFVDLETRYDSNVSYSSSAQSIGDLILHVRPGVEIKSPGDLAAIEFSGAIDWSQYLGIEGDTTNLSKLYADAGLAALFNRRGAVSLRVDNDFRRQVSSTSLAAAGVAVVSNANTLSLSAPWKPGGGALIVTANGSWLLETFQKYKDDPGVALGDLGYSQFRAGADVQWRFLPRTSGIFSAGYFARVPNAANGPDDATGFDLLAGVTGLVTPRIAATAKVGYGSASAPLKDSSSVLADVGVEWLPSETISFRTGYTRSFGIDPTASTYVADGVNAGFRVRMAERFAFRGGIRYDRLAFQAIPGAETSFVRVDPSIEGSLGKWLTLATGYVYSTRAASWPAGLGGAPPAYSKNEAFLKLGLTY
ncbi:MAG TPA: outer membrane beta-barrel protein [Anaeromyxobacter sp.]